MSTIEINAQFKRAIDLLNEGKQSLFITGKAGVGKSTLLEHFFKQAKKKPVVLAPTGVAALNVKGQTIHSFFNFYIDVSPEKILKKDQKPKNINLYKQLSTIIIDEISMVRADLLDCIDTFLRVYGPSAGLPFGGVQMVLVGDLYQLPPVVSADEANIFGAHYESPYFFSAKALDNLSLEIVELDKVYRQKDETFVALLNRVRNNSVEPEDIATLNTRFIPGFVPHEGEFYINLTTTNQRADEINAEHLEAISGNGQNYEAEITGTFTKEYYPTAFNLQFKLGAQVMLLNNDPQKRYVNGTVGRIESVKTINGEDVVKVRLQDCGKRVNISRFKWEVFKFFVDAEGIKSDLVGTFTQFPFRLAWAVTIHKSQGKTFERVIIDVGRGSFASGQIYVGLSRCTSFSGLVLKTPIRRHHIRTDPLIHKFMTSCQYQKAASEISVKEKISLIQEAARRGDVLSMTYLKANDSKSHQLVKPLKLGTATFQGKPFPAMRAFSTTTNQESIFHIGRILELEKVV